MALKAMMLRKRIDDAKKSLEDLRAKSQELETRKAEIETAIGEAKTEEERSAVEESIDAYEADAKENADKIGELERTIEGLEKDLEAEEAAQDTPTPAPEGRETPAPAENRERTTIMRNRDFFGMSIQERDAFVAREDVKAFLTEVRDAIKEHRALTNAGLLIPKVMLGLLRENIQNYSKLYRHANVRRIGGTGRMVIEGAIPEAVWTEMCANLNELDLAFSQVEVDGYKVGGYFRVCNAVLEDSDIDLAAELLSVLGQAIGYALDKAILFGTGTKMPKGILPELLGVTGTPNVVSIAASQTGAGLFKALVIDSGLAKGKYSRGEKTWVMNETTYTTLIAEGLSINAAGAIVSGINGTMPVIGGAIEVLNFVPDNVIIGGYFDLYLLAERAGTEFNTSEHAFWVADQTGFKGTARYDGKVLDKSAFVAIGLNGVTPSTTGITFAADTANPGA